MPTVTLDKFAVQDRLEKHFGQFQTREINGMPVQLLPSKQDIPLVKRVAYSPAEDIFEIMFANKSVVKRSEKGGIVFLEDAEHRLIGIQVLQPKKRGVKQIEFELLADLDDVIRSAKVNLQKDPNPKLATKVDIEERKVGFLKEIIKEDLNKLVSSVK